MVSGSAGEKKVAYNGLWQLLVGCVGDKARGS